MNTCMHMCKTVFYNKYETDGWSLWWAVDLKLLIRNVALQLSSIYLLFYLSPACSSLPFICFTIPI